MHCMHAWQVPNAGCTKGLPVQQGSLLLWCQQAVLWHQHMLCDVYEKLRCVELQAGHSIPSHAPSRLAMTALIDCHFKCIRQRTD